MSFSPHGLSAAGPRIDVGDPAPAFRLRRTFEESVGLDDLTTGGPVLLLFYVFDFGHV
jgi:peroxiredoxin